LLTGENQQLIAVSQKFQREETDIQKFWLAQAFYNLGQFQKAEEILVQLENKTEFSLRSKLMQILIDIETNSISDEHFKKLQDLKDTFSPKDSYYKVVVITQARLYFETGQYQEALNNYFEYAELTDKTPNEISLEIAHTYNQIGNTEKAISYLNNVIENESDKSYYTEAKILLAEIYQSRGEYEISQLTISTSIDKITEINQLLKEKYKLMESIRRQYNQLSSLASEEQKKLALSEIDNNETKLQEISDRMAEISRYLTSEQIEQLTALEHIYAENYKIVNRINEEIDYLLSNNNEEIPITIDHEIALLDSAKIRLNAVQYVSNLSEITVDDFRIAYFIANEQFYNSKMVESWQKLLQQNKLSNQSSDKIRESISLFEENQNSLESIAKFLFGEINENDNIQRDILYEKMLVEAKQDSLMLLRQDIWENYHKVLARKLSAEKNEFVAETNQIDDDYQKLLAEIRKDAEKRRQEYDFVKLDLEFREYRKKLTMSDSDTTIEEQ